MRKEEVQHRRESDRETERESLGVLPQSVVNLGNFWTMGDVEQAKMVGPSVSVEVDDTATSAADVGAERSDADPKKDVGNSLSVPAPGGVFPLPNSQQLATSGSATGNPRNKVSLRPGFSLMDWIRLSNSGEDLAGVGGKTLEVTKKELARHNKRKDAWMAVQGKVYNVTAYMDYHPGGWDELIRGAGKDATDLFNEVHRWVNYESMLSACLVGKLVDEAERKGEEEERKKKSPSASASSFTKPSLPSSKPVIPPIRPKAKKPSYDFHQTNSSFVLSVYTRTSELERENVIADLQDAASRRRLSCLLQMPTTGMAYSITVDIDDGQLDLDKVRVNGSGKAEVSLSKRRLGRRTEARLESDRFCRLSELETSYRGWTVAERRAVTHDVDQMVLRPPIGSSALFFSVPLGHHVQMRATVEGMEVARSYTPVPPGLSAVGGEKDEDEEDGRLHFLIKTYPDGALTPKLKRLNVGDRIAVSNHTGDFRLDSKSASGRHFALLAAGTGFTPMAGLARRALEWGAAGVKLIFFNKTERDIIWRRELEEAEKRHKGVLSVVHVLSAQDDWPGEKGRVSPELLERLLGARRNKSGEQKCFAAVCGPNAFTDKARKLLSGLGYKDGEVFLFQG